jgi:complement component 1 Q subcomponent-binding protein
LPEAFQDEEAADAGSGGLGDEAVGASETSFPLETSITITKPSGGAMTIDAIAQGEHRHSPLELLTVPGRARGS